MISEKDKNKLKDSILKNVYQNYETSTSKTFETILLCSYLSSKIDVHDINLVLKSLKCDSFIDADFSKKDDWPEEITITKERYKLLLQ